MKYVFIIPAMMLLLGLSAYALPSLTQFVTDDAGVLDAPTITALTQMAAALQRAGIAEYAILIVNDTGGQDIDGYAHRRFEGTLGTVDKNNGLLLLIVTDQRAYRTEVGRGLEPILNDAKVGRFAREQLVPFLEVGDYNAGVYRLSVAFNNELVNQSRTLTSPPSTDNGSILTIIVLACVVVAGIVIVKKLLGGTP